MSPGQKRQDAALRKTIEDLRLPEDKVRREFRKRRIYMLLLRKKGPGFILLLGGRGVASTWGKHLTKNDTSLVLEYQEKFLSSLSSTAAELNSYAAQHIIDIIVKWGWSYKAGIRSTLLDCLSKYVPLLRPGQDTLDGIRNKRHLDLDDEGISAKRIRSTEETPAELDTSIQLVKGARLKLVQTFDVTGQAFRDTAEVRHEMMRPAEEFETQYQVPQPLNGLQMSPCHLQNISTTLHPGGFEVTQGMQQCYLEDISTILQPGGF